MRTPAAVFAVAILLLAPGTVHPAIWRVPSSCPTVQAGIDSASAGDTVLVHCGTYFEHDIVMKSGICLRSTTGEPECVTLDARKLGRVMLCEDVDSSTRIEGFTLAAGYASGSTYPDDAGGGMLCVDSDVCVSDCRFVGNLAEGGGGAVRLSVSPAHFERCEFLFCSAWNGGGVYCSSSSPDLSECTFEGNYASHWGGGMCAGVSSSASLEGCLFQGNSAQGGGGFYAQFSDPVMTRCAFVSNNAADGGGMQVRESNPVLSGCTFSGNSANYAGALYSFDDSSPELHGCTLFGNSGLMAAGGLICTYGGSPVLENTIIAFSTKGAAIGCYQCAPALTCCDLYGNEGGDWTGDIAGQYGVNGNISLDPLFCDPGAGDLRIQDKSPCAPFSPPNKECDLIGAWPVGCGTTGVLQPETVPASWSSVKALYR